MLSFTKRKTKGDIVFDILNILLMFLICLTTLYPFLYLLAMSFGNSALMGLNLLPKKLDFSAYRQVLQNTYMFSGFTNTIIKTVIGTALTLLFTISAAYPLSKKNFPNRNVWTSLVVFTMFFSGGLIPNYLLVSDLGLLNSMWSLILPGLISTYNMIIMRNFFMSLPDSLEEAAKIDGANDIRILRSIIIPVSLPIIATIALWTVVGHWNAWFDSMIYIKSANKQVLKLILRRIVIEGTSQLMDLNGSVDAGRASPENIKAASIIVATLPILIAYPFLQKYFVKGVMVGSLKG